VVGAPPAARTRGLLTGFLPLSIWIKYFGLGHFELIDADWLIQTGTLSRESGFTAHPRYLAVAEKYGIIDIWEKRGAPDHCKKLDGQWICQ
jgi:hypothetical protein